MSLLNVGARALLTNQVALQTTGHNIANVSTVGYSRQSTHLVSMPGQYTSNGYIGKGVDVQTILRNYDQLLTRQAALAGSAQSSDVARAERLGQMQEIFSGGNNSVGTAISDMLGALSDVLNAPTDMTARTVTLTRMEETAGRFRSAAERLGDIEYAVNEQLKNNVTKINTLAQGVAELNEKIAAAQGNGQVPNDLLDKRDQLIRELNQYIQTSQIPADDGSVGLFVAGGQPLVLGFWPASLAIREKPEFPGSKQMGLYFERPNAPSVELQDSMLGGGEIQGLLRFANNDMAEGRNLLGRMAQTLGMTMNAQHKLGLTLDGQTGKDLFAVTAQVNGLTNGSGVGSIDFSDPTKNFDPTKFAASDYEVRFTAGGDVQILRLSDNKTTTFTGPVAYPADLEVDGLTFSLTTAGGAGERMLFKPFGSTAQDIQSLVKAPNDLAAANPINAAMGTSNSGSLQLAGLKATGIPALTPPAIGTPAVLTFNGAGGFTVAGGGTPVDISTDPPTPLAGPPYSYTSGQAIHIDGWQITLQGTPRNGDTVAIGNALDPQYGDAYQRNAGNGGALMALRDVKMFDTATLQDGWASAMAQVGTRAQSANYAANMSTTIANNLERDRAAVSGVNLDEEAAKLIQYQQAYQASAKMLQIAQGIFDSLIQTVGR